MEGITINIKKLSILGFVCIVAFLISLGTVPALGQTTWNVPGDASNTCTVGNSSCNTIQGAIDAATSGDTIVVAAGNYPENLILSKSLTLRGAQAGIDACGRIAIESIIATSGSLLTLVTGSAGSVIDGFTFSGGTRQIESASGPIDNVQILNNRFVGFTGNGVFLNDNGIDITVSQNSIDGASQASGGAFHLDQDNFDGFHFIDNCVSNGVTGFFVDGNRNVGSSLNRSPLFSGNIFELNVTGVNIGSRAIEDAEISGNTFKDNDFDGLQGGPKNTMITDNSFTGNGRSGLALTSFGNTNSDRGAQNNSITNNCFTGNGFINSGRAVSFSATQFAGTISTNTLNQNNISGNAVGAGYTGTETINAENNWWGAADGPSGNGTGSGDVVDGISGGGAIDFDPFLTVEASDTPCSPPLIEEICSTLGDDRFRFLPDVDVFIFEGMEGETVHVTLDYDPDGVSHGNKAALSLFNRIGHGFIFKTDIGPLPDEITVKLKKNGTYWITVQELFRHGAFRGDYCLTIESDAADQPELLPTPSVE